MIAPNAANRALEPVLGTPRRNYLFLQGPIGSFFSRLAARLKDQGHGVHRINFNGGDRVFASPITFLSRGKQLITIPIGDVLIAFALEE